MQTEAAILIADDEPILLEQLAEIVASLGYPIVTANDGSDLLSKVNSNKNIVAVLSDIKMPKMTGLDVLKFMRENNNHTPMVFLTGYGGGDILNQALSLGAHDLLEKPFKVEDLLEVLSAAIETSVVVDKS